jgi:hypothetical protein
LGYWGLHSALGAAWALQLARVRWGVYVSCILDEYGTDGLATRGASVALASASARWELGCARRPLYNVYTPVFRAPRRGATSRHAPAPTLSRRSGGHMEINRVQSRRPSVRAGGRERLHTQPVELVDLWTMGL